MKHVIHQMGDAELIAWARDPEQSVARIQADAGMYLVMWDLASRLEAVSR